MVDRRGAYWVFVGGGWEHKGKKILGRPGRRKKDNIKMNFKIFEWGVQLDCCGSERREFAGASESSNAHSGSRKCGNFLTS